LGVLKWTPEQIWRSTYIDMQLAVRVHMDNETRRYKEQREWDRVCVRVLSQAGNYKKPVDLTLPWDQKAKMVEDKFELKNWDLLKSWEDGKSSKKLDIKNLGPEWQMR